MVALIMIQPQSHQQASSAAVTLHNNPSSSSSSLRSSVLASSTTSAAPLSTPPSNIAQLPLSLSPVNNHGIIPSLHRQGLPLPPPANVDNVAAPVMPISVAYQSGEPGLAMPGQLGRVRLSEISPFDGAPNGPYARAVEALWNSLKRHNAALIELGVEDTAVMRCGLEGARLYFRCKAQQSLGKRTRAVHTYRAGRSLEDTDFSPPCMADIFKCMGKVARAALCAISRHLRLRSDAFIHLLDDTPLPASEVSSSVVVATYSHSSSHNGRSSLGGGQPAMNSDIEKGLVTLISSDAPGLQVCDPNGRWYLADIMSAPGDLLLLTGKALSHVTAGLRPATSYRVGTDYSSSSNDCGRTSLAFRLMPQANAILDCSPIAAAGHVIPQSYVAVSVSQFMDDLSAEEDVLCTRPDSNSNSQNTLNKEASLRTTLSDPISGAFLEDAMFVPCGHSFGGLMLRRVIEMSRCTLCNAEIETGSLIPNLALRAAAAAVKCEDERRLFHNASIRKRRKDMGDQTESIRRPNRENGELAVDEVINRGVQYPFAVNEKVIIKGNRRTPEKFVGKEAVITSQCLNGWYLLKIVESGENVRLQYRSLRKISNPLIAIEDTRAAQPSQNRSS